MNTKFFAKLINLGMVNSMLFSLGLQITPVHALPASTPSSQEKAIDCLGDLQGTLSVTPQPIRLWETGTLRWNVTVPTSCTGVGIKLYVDSQLVSPTGSRTIQPIADTSTKLHATLPAVLGGGRRTLATASIKVDLPEPPTIISIYANHMEPLLLQALREGNKHIRIENHVELDLTGWEALPIAGGVTLEGGRTPRHPGPRLYTTIRPAVLFETTGDNIRITGVRIEGPDHVGVVPDGDNKGIGIFVSGDINIEIDNNEIYGWSQAAVRVNDCDGNEGCQPGGRMLPSENPTVVRIHDNFIHHNQHEGSNGYGVSVNAGAFVLIERNVFDWNRHAIKGAGEAGTGYAAYRNPVLKNGGYHDTYCVPLYICPGGIPVYHHYTHQFDVHGTDTCFPGHANCGDAGHSMFIHYNTFLYTAGNAIKLRGIPEEGMFIGANVFAHNNWEDAVVATQFIGTYAEPGNVFGVDASTDLGVCDFDGDSLPDTFMATGATWWFSSGSDRPWVYLNTSTKRRSEVTLGHFDGDNRCDVLADGVIYPGGKPQKLPVNRVPLGGVLTSTSLSH